MIEAEVSKLMDDHGEFVDADEWNCQAQLEEELMLFCKDKFGEEPAHSTLAAPISRGLAKWREKKLREVADN
jgi:hypothetical protein